MAGQGAKKTGRRDASPVSCWLAHGPGGVCGDTRVCTSTCGCTFTLLLTTTGCLDPSRLNFEAFLGSWNKESFAVVQTVYPRWGFKGDGSCMQGFYCELTVKRSHASFPTDQMLPFSFSSPDHCVHYYDLRNTKQPIMVFKGHRKAVSYAKFVSGEEIVSA